MQKANPKNIKHFLDKISFFTEKPGLIDRPSFSPSWRAVVDYFISCLNDLGMSWRMDGCGNVIGTYNPDGYETKPVGIGSHIDTVRNGGVFDGGAGIAAALELVRVIIAEDYKLGHPLEIVAFIEEEGGVFGKGCLGSEYLSGHSSLDKFASFRNALGETVQECADACGYLKTPFGEDHGWAKNYYENFYEVHIEQGAVLEENQKRLGVVTGVVCITRNCITFRGQANHAGTTVMSRRKDAMVALSKFIIAADELAKTINGQAVITNGKITVSPNQHNVIPGVASTVLELRAPDDELAHRLMNELERTAESIAAEAGLCVDFSAKVFVPAKMFDERLVSSLLATGANRNDVIPVFSWAGHDAKLVSFVSPTVMVFIPSKNGLSHCPEEYSDEEDIAAAVDFIMENWRSDF